MWLVLLYIVTNCINTIRGGSRILDEEGQKKKKKIFFGSKINLWGGVERGAPKAGVC